MSLKEKCRSTTRHAFRNVETKATFGVTLYGALDLGAAALAADVDVGVEPFDGADAAVAQLVGPVGLKTVGAGLTFTYGNQWFKKISFKIIYSLNNPKLNA